MQWSENRIEDIEYKLVDSRPRMGSDGKTFIEFVELGDMPYIQNGSLQLSALNDIKATASLTFEGPDKIQNGKFVRIYSSVLDSAKKIQYRDPLATLLFEFGDPKFKGDNIAGSLKCNSVLNILKNRKLKGALTVKRNPDVMAVPHKVRQMVEECNISFVDKGFIPTVWLTGDVTFKANASYLEVCNTLLKAIGATDLLPDAYGNVYFDKYISLDKRAVQWEFKSGKEAIFLPEIDQKDSGLLTNVWTEVYEKDTERIVATATNNDPSSPYSVKNVGYEIGEGETSSNLTSSDLDGRIQELREIAIEKLQNKYSYTTTTDFTAAYVPVIPDMAVSLDYKMADVKVKGVVDTMDITLGPGMQTKFTVSTLHKDKIKIDSTSVCEWKSDGYEPTGYTVKPDGDSLPDSISWGGMTVWKNDISIFPKRMYAFELNTRKTKEKGEKVSQVDVMNNLDQTNYSKPKDAPWWEKEKRDAGNPFHHLVFYNFSDGTKANDQFKPKSLKNWFAFDYNITDEEEQLNSKSGPPCWYVNSANKLWSWVSFREGNTTEKPTDTNPESMIPFFNPNDTAHFTVDMSRCEDLSYAFYNIFANFHQGETTRARWIQFQIAMCNWNTLAVKTMAWMFGRSIMTAPNQPTKNTVSAPTYFPCKKWCVSNLENMEHLFDNQGALLQTAEVVDASGTGTQEATGLQGSYGLDLRYWERSPEINPTQYASWGASTTANIKNMRKAFATCNNQNFQVVDMSQWKIKSRLGETYQDMFSGCNQKMIIKVPWKEGEVPGAPWGASHPETKVIYKA